MIARTARVFGIVFLLIGVMGFIPGITMNGYLLGIFHVNTVHNLIHLITGAAFLFAGSRGNCSSMRTFQVFTIVYGLVTVLGFIFHDRLFLGPMAHNMADALLHLGITAVSFYYGFLARQRYAIQCPA